MPVVSPESVALSATALVPDGEAGVAVTDVAPTQFVSDDEVE